MNPAGLETNLGAALLYSLTIAAIATGVAAVIARRWPTANALLPQPDGRAGCIDGLRGYLALGVFIHHSFTAYVYFLTGRWEWSASALMNQLGQSTVALFFMITGYLFSQRLLDADKRELRWAQLFRSRVLRLTPMYVVSVLCVIVSVGLLTRFTARESAQDIAREVADWLLFAIPDRPDINALPMTWTVMAGVNWSLQYEWYFYASLPLMYWPLRLLSKSTTLARLSVALLGVALLKSIVSGHNVGQPRLYVLHFACGIATALTLRDSGLGRMAASMPFRVLAACCLVRLAFLKSADGGEAVALTWAIFLAVAAGASAFGLLRARAAVWLGEISYSIYLLHGLMLFWLLTAMRLTGSLPAMQIATYWLIIATLAVAVVMVSSVSFVFIERPAMRAGKQQARQGHVLLPR